MTVRIHHLPLVALALALSAASTDAGENLRLEMDQVAKQIKQWLTQEGVDALSVGAYTGSSRLASSSGPAIQKLLGDELKKLGVAVKTPANYEVKGDYLDIVDETTAEKLTGVKVVSRIYDRQGNDLVKFTRLVHGNKDLIEMSGVTADLGPQGDQEGRNHKIAEAINKPQCHVQGANVSTHSGCPYNVALTVKEGSGYRPRNAQVVDGRAFVKLDKGDVFAVKITNHSPYDAAVTIHLDGVNMFALSKARTQDGKPFQYMILAPGKSYEVKGWHVDLAQMDEFKVTDFLSSVAKELKSTAGLGTITVTFAAAWEKGNDAARPKDEPTSRSAETRGIGKGARIDEKTVEVERDYGAVRAAITLRYEK